MGMNLDLTDDETAGLARLLSDTAATGGFPPFDQLPDRPSILLDETKPLG